MSSSAAGDSLRPQDERHRRSSAPSPSTAPGSMTEVEHGAKGGQEDNSPSLAKRLEEGRSTGSRNGSRAGSPSLSSQGVPSTSSPPTPPSQSSEKQPRQDPNLVDWHGSDDPENPKNWSPAKKWLTMVIISTCSFCVTLNSSIVTSTFDYISTDFGISREVAILGLSLFVAGLGLGPLLLGPASEVFGRKPIYIVALTSFWLFQFPVAFANNAPVFMIFRFLCGLTGSAFLSVSGGTVADLYSPNDLFTPMCFYSASPFLGPSFGPLIGNFISTYARWNWCFWTTIIWTFCQLLAVAFLSPETYAPKLLTLRARKLRKETGNEKLYSQQEQAVKDMNFKRQMVMFITRVPMLLALEPMLLLLCIWSALLLGILYLLFEAFPIVFEQQHGFTAPQTGLAFLGQSVGIVFAYMTIPYWSKVYRRAAARNGGQAPPEARLPMCMVGSFLTPVGLFIFAFTSYSHVHWIAPIIALVPFGAGVLFIYTGVFTYTTTAWLPVAASAMSANSLLRSAWAGAFPLFATQMYNGLGTVGASALLAGVNVLMIPIPFVLYRYGPAIRARSKYTL